MKTKLKDIAHIQTGVFAKPSVNGEVVYIQVRHFNETGKLLESLHPDLMHSDFNSRHILQPGNILFSSKGNKNFAVVIEIHFPPSVASTSFFVIRLTAKNVLPSYLAWFLNHPDSQQMLKSQSQSTSMPSISKSVLEELEISVPDLLTQEKILKINHLRETEKKLKNQMETLREKQIQQMILNALK